MPLFNADEGTYSSPFSYRTPQQDAAIAAAEEERRRQEEAQRQAQQAAIQQAEANRQAQRMGEDFDRQTRPVMDSIANNAIDQIHQQAVDRIQNNLMTQDTHSKLDDVFNRTAAKIQQNMGEVRATPPESMAVDQSQVSHGGGLGDIVRGIADIPLPTGQGIGRDNRWQGYVPEGATITNDRPTLGGLAQAFVSPQVSPEDIPGYNAFPPVTHPLADVASGFTAPAAGLSAAFPEATLLGAEGSVELGAAGNLADIAGAPNPLPVSYKTLGEGLGSLRGGKGLVRELPPVTDLATVTANPMTAQDIQRAGMGIAGGAVDVPPGIVADNAIEKVKAALTQQSLNIGDTTAVRHVDLVQRSGQYASMYEKAIAQGKTPMEARGIARSALGGEYAQGVGTALNLSEDEKLAVWGKIDSSDLKPLEQNRADIALTKLDTGQALQRNEVDLLGKLYGPDFAKTLSKSGTWKDNALQMAYDVSIVPKALKSAFDLSFPLRQGLIALPTHPTEWFRQWVPMIQSAAKEKWAQQIHNELISNPAAHVFEDGSTITSGEIHQLVTRHPGAPNPGVGEVAFGGRNLAEHIPLIGPFVRGSNRAFTTAGNVLRSYVLDTLVRNAEEGGKFGNMLGREVQGLTPDRLQAMADYVNRMTMRGTIGEGAFAKVAQSLAWAPQQSIAPAQWAGYAAHADPFVRQQAWRDMAAFVTAGSAVMLAAKMAGGEVGLDPRSSSFGKITIGGTHLNIFGPAQVMARYATQFALGGKVPAGGGPFTKVPRISITSDSIAGEYARSRLSPIPGAVLDVGSGTTYTHEPVTTWSELQNLFTPLAYKDAYDAFKTNGLAGAPVAAGAVAGASVQSYDASPKQQVYGMPRFEGLTIEQDDKLRDFAAQVEQQYQMAHRANPNTAVTHAQIAATMPNELGSLPSLYYGNDLNVNPKRVNYAIQNQDALDGITLANSLPIRIARVALSDSNFQKYLDGRSHTTDVPDPIVDAATSLAGALP